MITQVGLFTMASFQTFLWFFCSQYQPVDIWQMAGRWPEVGHLSLQSWPRSQPHSRLIPQGFTPRRVTTTSHVIDSLHVTASLTKRSEHIFALLEGGTNHQISRRPKVPHILLPVGVNWVKLSLGWTRREHQQSRAWGGAPRLRHFLEAGVRVPST